MKVLQHTEEATSRLVGGLEVWNRSVPHLDMVVKNQERYLGCRVPPEEEGVPAPHWVSQPRVPVPREVPLMLGIGSGYQ